MTVSQCYSPDPADGTGSVYLWSVLEPGYVLTVLEFKGPKVPVMTSERFF